MKGKAVVELEGSFQKTNRQAREVYSHEYVWVECAVNNK